MCHASRAAKDLTKKVKNLREIKVTITGDLILMLRFTIKQYHVGEAKPLPFKVIAL